MKKRDLVKRVQEIGAEKMNEGGKHEIWKSKNGGRFTIPRHSEINEITAQAILKQAAK